MNNAEIIYSDEVIEAVEKMREILEEFDRGYIAGLNESNTPPHIQRRLLLESPVRGQILKSLNRLRAIREWHI